MRIKLLSVIVSFLLLSIGISSCLDSDETYEFSTDATVHAFGLDTIYGKHYTFTIDQLNRLIYNRDSLPVGADTLIDRILIDTFSVTGWVTSGSPIDTIFNMADSVDLRPAMNSEGMKFKVFAADGVTSREYTLQVHVHLQDPDSLMWNNMEAYGAPFAEMPVAGEQRCVILHNELLLYTGTQTIYRTSTLTGEYGWSQSATEGLPADALPTTLIQFGGRLYMLTPEGDVFTSGDGTRWSRSEGLSGTTKALVAAMEADELAGRPAMLAGIGQDAEGVTRFCTTTDGATWSYGEEVPEGFPTRNIYHTMQLSATGTKKCVAVGMPATRPEATVPWFTADGMGWAQLNNTAYDTYCPILNNPSIFYYGDRFYCMGEGFEALYASITALAWRATEEKVLLPEGLKGVTSYSMAVDDNRFIWIVAAGQGTPNAVWRGRLNRFGFDIQ